jgi:hypothetical protein
VSANRYSFVVRWTPLLLTSLVLATGCVGGTHQSPPMRAPAQAGSPTTSGTVGAGRVSEPSPPLSWTVLAARPLHLPAVAPGVPWPRSTAASVDPAYAPASGPGPVYVVLLEDRASGAVVYDAHESALDAESWYHVKMLWIAAPSYRGPALVRRRQIDGEATLEFATPPQAPVSALQLAAETGATSAGTVRGWRDRPSETLVQAPGCYALQVDGLNLSEVIVFEARR